MTAFIVRRLLMSLFVLVGISFVLFILLRLTPGDPAEMMLDPLTFSGNREAGLALMRDRLGLDQPIFVQYISWGREVLQGNLGFSYARQEPVLSLITRRLNATVVLMVSALAIALAVGVPVGIMAAIRHNKMTDYVASVMSLIAISVPAFFVALLGIYVFGITLGWLPTAGMNTPDGGFFTGLRFLVLPAGILGLSMSAPYVRWARSSMLDVLGEDYLVTARSKGLTPFRINLRHAFPNALIPLVSVIAIQIPNALGGAVIIEQIFAWPGMGRMAIQAVTARDYPVLLGWALFIALLVLLFNLLADVLYAVIDPRIRL